MTIPVTTVPAMIPIPILSPVEIVLLSSVFMSIITDFFSLVSDGVKRKILELEKKNELEK